MTDDPSARAHARVGDVLNDKWTLERLLGVGGMGAVYAGRHRNGARAAVKVLHRYLACLDDVRARFLREGHAANRVEHPSVVKVLDDDTVLTGPDAGTAYLVMELLEGESLESRSHREPTLSEREFLEVAEVVLEVLEVAHQNGVVHRDIKPDNIFITVDGVGRDRIKVLDFGLARLLEGHSTTVHGLALGTPSYMAPEQAAGHNDEIDGRTDLFALAATGLKLVTGRKVHEGVNGVEIVVKMGNVPAARVREVAPEVSEELAHVLDTALEFKREDRYETAAAMRADVMRALAAIEKSAKEGVPTAQPAPWKTIQLTAADLEVEAPSATASPSSAGPARSTANAPPSPSLRSESVTIPQRRVGLPYLLAGFALACIGAGAAYAIVGAGPAAPPAEAPLSPTAATSQGALPQDSPDADLREGATDASLDAEVRTPDASDASSRRIVRRLFPPRRPLVSGKPPKKPKH